MVGSRATKNYEFQLEVRALFDFISDGSPRVVSSTYDDRSFGNAMVELEGTLVRVRPTRDRGQFLVDLSPRHRYDWFDEETVLRSVEADADADALIADNWSSLAASAAALKRNFERIARTFQPASWSNTRELLTELQRRRAAALFGRSEP